MSRSRTTYHASPYQANRDFPEPVPVRKEIEMAVVAVAVLPGGNQETYESTSTGRPAANFPTAARLHVAGPVDEGWRTSRSGIRPSIWSDFATRSCFRACATWRRARAGPPGESGSQSDHRVRPLGGRGSDCSGECLNEPMVRKSARPQACAAHSRPSTNQIAWTGSSPTFANRCGVVHSNPIESPGPSSWVVKPIVTWRRPDRTYPYSWPLWRNSEFAGVDSPPGP